MSRLQMPLRTVLTKTTGGTNDTRKISSSAVNFARRGTRGAAAVEGAAIGEAADAVQEAVADAGQARSALSGNTAVLRFGAGKINHLVITGRSARSSRAGKPGQAGRMVFGTAAKWTVARPGNPARQRRLPPGLVKFFNVGEVQRYVASLGSLRGRRWETRFPSPEGPRSVPGRWQDCRTLGRATDWSRRRSMGRNFDN